MKASEVFDLPVSVGEYNMDNDNIYSASGEWCATLFSDEQAKVAANCINHADALAHALAVMLVEHSKYQLPSKESIQAAQAFEAYRSAK